MSEKSCQDKRCIWPLLTLINIPLSLALFGLLCFLVACNQEPVPQKSPQERAYNTLCSGCHHRQGNGIPGTYPKLNGHIQRLLQAEGGRDYLLNVAVHGVSGSIQVDEVIYTSVMPPISAAPHQSVADALNYVMDGWGNPPANRQELAPFSADEILKARTAKQSPEETYRQRPDLSQSPPDAPSEQGSEKVLDEGVDNAPGSIKKDAAK